MSTPDKTAKRVFISHSSEDAVKARKVCELLESRGIRCWIAPRNVRPGEPYGEAIIRGIQQSDALVLLMTRNANASRPVANEVERAFSNRKLIIPFRLEDVTPCPALEFFVASAQWVEASDRSLDKAVGVLVEELAVPSEAAPAAPAARPSRRIGRGPAVLAAAACAVLLAAGFLLVLRRGGAERLPPAPAVRPAPAGGAAAPEAPAGIVPRYRALIIGINKYAPYGGAGWTALKTARSDAAAVATVLKNKYGFHVNTLFDAEATRGAILDALQDLVGCSDNDACVVYFAGHGYYDEELGEGYWIPCDSKRVEDGRAPKEDWLWNSIITKILGASAARHILVIADSCYGGSLFRSDAVPDPTQDMKWYRRAIVRPSRYLIASGDLEPVLDDGAQHSIFADQMLNYLQHTEKDVFSASDLGMSLRESVSALTGQMVQMGPLAVAGHGGGEFVFVKPEATTSLTTLDVTVDSGLAMRGDDAVVEAARSEPAVRQHLLRDALALSEHGAEAASRKLLSLASAAAPDDRLAAAVTAHLDAQRREMKRKELAAMVAVIEKRKAAQPERELYADMARPRILACLGPAPRTAAAEGESLASLYRICLRGELQGRAGLRVVEREALQAVLEELQLGASDLADARVRTAIGKLLPAGLLLLGDLMVFENGEKLYLRLVDTETSAIVATFADGPGPEEDLPAVAARLADRIAAATAEVRPLAAPAQRLEDGSLAAGIGAFHGANAAMRFEVIARVPGDKKRLEPYREEVIGAATIETIDELSSRFSARWSDGEPGRDADLWLREAAAEG